MSPGDGDGSEGVFSSSGILLGREDGSRFVWTCCGFCEFGGFVWLGGGS